MSEENIRYFLERLRHRVLREAEHLHYMFLVKERRYVCLDLSLTSDSFEGLDKLCQQWIAAHKPEDPLPAAPESEWRKLAEVFDDRNNRGGKAIFTSRKWAFKVRGKIYRPMLESWPR